MGNVLPRFHGYLFLQKQTRLLKSWFVHSAGERNMCKISFFMLDFWLCTLRWYSCVMWRGRCKKYRRAVQWSASLNCSLSQNCHKTFAFSPLIPKQMIADPQTTVQSENLVFPDQTNKLYKIHISEKKTVQERQNGRNCHPLSRWSSSS